MSKQEIEREVLREEEEMRCYIESQEAYKWLLENVYAKEDTRA